MNHFRGQFLLKKTKNFQSIINTNGIFYNGLNLKRSSVHHGRFKNLQTNEFNKRFIVTVINFLDQ